MVEIKLLGCLLHFKYSDKIVYILQDAQLNTIIAMTCVVDELYILSMQTSMVCYNGLTSSVLIWRDR